MLILGTLVGHHALFVRSVFVSNMVPKLVHGSAYIQRPFHCHSYHYKAFEMASHCVSQKLSGVV